MREFQVIEVPVSSYNVTKAAISSIPQPIMDISILIQAYYSVFNICCRTYVLLKFEGPKQGFIFSLRLGLFEHAHQKE